MLLRKLTSCQSSHVGPRYTLNPARWAFPHACMHNYADEIQLYSKILTLNLSNLVH